MAYFPNGTSGLMYQEDYCFNCINYRDKNDGRGSGCAIWDVHLLYSCHAKDESREILDCLIPEKDCFAQECSMFLQNPEVLYNRDQLKLELGEKR